MEKLIQFLIKNKIKYDQNMLDNVNKYYDFLIEYNKNVNLTAITDKNEYYLKHVCDSLLGIFEIPKNAIICDIGTGAGFPGVILKIFRPDIKLFLVDSLKKRTEFLSRLVHILNLEDVTVIHSRVEEKEFKDKYLNYFDVVVARAVASMNTLAEYCIPFVRNGGLFVAYKSENVDDELKLSYNAINILGASIYKIMCYKLNNDITRKIIIISKTHNTNAKYPRSQNKPRLSPL